MCHFRDDATEATERERELRGEYTVHFDEEPDEVEREELAVVPDGGEE